MTSSGSIVVRFRESRVRIDWDGGLAWDIVSFLFRKHEHAGSPDGEAIFSLDELDDRHLLCRRNGKGLVRGTPEKVGVTLLDAVLYELAKPCDSGLLFHAASVSHDGRGILMPGQSGSGKTVLSGWAACSGFTCMSDELSWVEPGELQLEGFFKPLHVKNLDSKEMRGVLSDIRQGRPFAENGLAAVGDGFLVDCRHLHGAVQPSPSTLELIIFPTYTPGEPCRVERLTTARTGLLLMQHFINARNFPNHGFESISSLAQRVPAYSIIYDDVSQVVRHLVTI